MQGHAYDKSKSGYVNLILGSSSKTHGDEDAMVLARTRFLKAGYYDPLKIRLIEIISELKMTSLVDLGCGEGTYTNAIQANLKIPIIGIDLSKTALKQASKAHSHVQYVLANITHVPLEDESVEAVLSIFSPIDLNECRRISKRYLILVRPCPFHLIELKEILYDHVFENPQPDINLTQSRCILEEELNFRMTLDQNALNDLLEMTPYNHTSPLIGLQRVKNCPTLSVSAQFHLSVFEFLHAATT